MRIEYTGYNFPQNNDTCVGICFFSPVKYYKPLYNLKIFLEQLQKHNIPYYIIELLYPNQQQQIENSIVVKANSVCFIKENLWNILEKHIPEQYSKIIFMDGDVLYTDRDWFDKTSTLLDDYDCVMSHEYIFQNLKFIQEINYAQKSDMLVSVIKTFQDESIDWWKFHPGFNIGINRDFFHQINGIYEQGITGYGDVLFWWSFIPDKAGPCSDFLTSEKFMDQAILYREYKTKILSVSSVDRLAYLKDNIAMHLAHGNKSNRYYTTRNGYVDGKVSLNKNEYGVLEIDIDGLNKDLIQYWINRKEDE